MDVNGYYGVLFEYLECVSHGSGDCESVFVLRVFFLLGMCGAGRVNVSFFLFGFFFFDVRVLLL